VERDTDRSHIGVTLTEWFCKRCMKVRAIEGGV
jgi:hypothetical protein